MKMLEWIHDRFRHNNIKPFKDLNIGSSCIRFSAQASLDDQETYRKPSFGSLEGFSESEASRDNEASDAISELFHGFLTIGTLGSDASVNEPATPTFATPLENITEEMIKVTENELKLINYELEKFLEAEGKEEGFEESSARNSDVSIISLGGKVMEKAEDEDYWKNLVCPLQGYLLGSSIDIPEAKNEEKASLGELFDHKEVAVENRNKHKSAMRFVKAIVKKVCPSSKSSLQAGSDAKRCYISEQKELHSATDSVSNKKKLHKVLRVFHRKIHPEPSMGERESDGVKKCMAKNTPKEGGDFKMVPKGSTSMDVIQSRGQQGNLNRNNLKGHGEHWIKIEEDYLVLEL